MSIAKIKAMKETLNNMKNMQAEVNGNIDKDIAKKRKAAFKKICEYLDEVADSLDGENVEIQIGKHGEIICCEDTTIYFNSKYCTRHASCSLERDKYSDSPIKWWIGGKYKHGTKRNNDEWYNYIDSEINIDWNDNFKCREAVNLIEGWKEKFKSQIEDGIVTELNKRMEKIRRDTTERVEQYEKVDGFEV